MTGLAEVHCGYSSLTEIYVAKQPVIAILLVNAVVFPDAFPYTSAAQKVKYNKCSLDLPFNIPMLNSFDNIYTMKS